ncbi:MAG: hypothetical protein V3V02_08350, partial [Rhizobiaceae bacterium]
MLIQSGESLTSTPTSRMCGLWIVRDFALRSCLASAIVATSFTSVSAQDVPIITPGNMAMTGFSKTYIPNFDAGLLPGVDPVD